MREQEVRVALVALYRAAVALAEEEAARAAAVALVTPRAPGPG